MYCWYGCTYTCNFSAKKIHTGGAIFFYIVNYEPYRSYDSELGAHFFPWVSDFDGDMLPEYLDQLEFLVHWTYLYEY